VPATNSSNRMAGVILSDLGREKGEGIKRKSEGSERTCKGQRRGGSEPPLRRNLTYFIASKGVKKGRGGTMS